MSVAVVAVLLRRRRRRRLMRLEQRARSRSYIREAHIGVANDKWKLFDHYFLRSIDARKDELHRFCHVTVEQFEELKVNLAPLLTRAKNHRWPISSRKRLLLFLRYLATGMAYDKLAHEFSIGCTTVAYIIRDVAKLIVQHMMPIFLPISTPDDYLQNAEAFENHRGFPRAVFAIDGKHIRIKCPPKSGSDYYNYKRFYSIVLLACVNPDYSFAMIDVGGAGSMSDSSLFANASFKSHVERDWSEPTPLGTVGNVPYVSLADGGFGISENIMTPFPRSMTLNREQLNFNERLSSARQTAENSFGHLVSRFRVFDTTMNVSKGVAKDITVAAVVLHNYLIRFRNEHARREPVLDPAPELVSVNTSAATTARERAVAKIYRERFMRHFRNEIATGVVYNP